MFDDVTPAMRIAREEIFGPVMSVLAWTDVDDMLAKVNAWSTVSRPPSSPMTRQRDGDGGARGGGLRLDQSTGRYLGAPYGGWKQSGVGEEECFDELLSYTQIKNINMRW